MNHQFSMKFEPKESENLKNGDRRLSVNLHTHHGMSLIELMITITLGIFLTLGLSQMFVNSKRGLTAVNDVVQLQENARLALYTMERIISEAGQQGKSAVVANSFYLGCYATKNNSIFSNYNYGYGISAKDCASWALTKNTRVNNLPTSLIFGFYNYFDEYSAATNCNSQEAVNFFSSPTIIAGTKETCNAQTNVPNYAAGTNLVLPGGAVDSSYYAYALYGARPFLNNGPSFSSDYITGTQGATALTSDTITVNLIGRDTSTGAPPILDCLGQPLPSNVSANFQFYIDNQKLVCYQYIPNVTSTFAILLEGVNVMKIQYGEDLDGDGVPNRYVSKPSFNVPGDEVFSVGTPLIANTTVSTLAGAYSATGSAYQALDARTVCEGLNARYANTVDFATLAQPALWCTPGWTAAYMGVSDILMHPANGTCPGSPSGGKVIIDNPNPSLNTRARVHCYGKKPKYNAVDPAQQIVIQQIAPFTHLADKEQWYQSGSFIINARVALLVQTPSDFFGFPDTNTYSVFNTPIPASTLATAEQKKFRKVFISTIRLKNVTIK